MKVSTINDPVFAAIEAHRKLLKECNRLYGALEAAVCDAEKKHGSRPGPATPWRMETRTTAASRAWDKRTGVAPLRKQYEQINRIEISAVMRLSKTKPKTPAGAGALVAYVRADLAKIELGEPDGPRWHLVALATAAKALAEM